MCALETLAFCDYSLSIKAGVHFTLCGGTICKLGTAVRLATSQRTSLTIHKTQQLYLIF